MDTTPILGTAMWGWTVEPDTAFDLLDEFYRRGHRMVDTATNYPINKRPEDFRKAERILAEWIQVNGVHDMKVMIKIGSVNNMRTPEIFLNKSFLLIALDEYRAIFGDNLHTIMVHWDNRSNESEIRETFDFFQIAHEAGFKLGLSGIRYPKVYATVNTDFNFHFSIQIKHNLLHSDYQRYGDFHNKSTFFAYGMNAGGIKLDNTKYTEAASLKARGWDGRSFEIVPALKSLLEQYNANHSRTFTAFHECGLLYAMYHPDISGVLIGTSRLEQLIKTLDLATEFSHEDYTELYLLLGELSGKHGAE